MVMILNKDNVDSDDDDDDEWQLRSVHPGLAFLEPEPRGARKHHEQNGHSHEGMKHD
jgi:hypothetical protein